MFSLLSIEFAMVWFVAEISMAC